MPIARLPDELADALGVKRPTVTVVDAAVGHNVKHHFSDWNWSRVQEMVEHGTVHRYPDGRILVVHEYDGRGFALITVRNPRRAARRSDIVLEPPWT
jgi:hypothetical protein